MRIPNRIESVVGRAIAWLAVLALAFAWSGHAIAQNNPRKVATEAPGDAAIGGNTGQLPATLDQALAAAMERNPGIAMAKAKLMLAEAELESARFEVAMKVLNQWGERQKQEEILSLANQKFQRVAELRHRGTVGGEEENYENAKKAVIEAQAKAAQSAIELRYVIGQGVSEASSRGGESRAPATPRATAAPLQLPRGPVVEKVRQALLAPTGLEFVETPLCDVVDYLKDTHKIEIQIDVKALSCVVLKPTMPITINLKKTAFGNALQAMEDQIPELKFVVRDYGLLVTTPGHAREQGYFPAIEFARLGVYGQGTGVSNPPTVEALPRSGHAPDAGGAPGRREFPSQDKKTPAPSPPLRPIPRDAGAK
jgi:hypothetical protein